VPASRPSSAPSADPIQLTLLGGFRLERGNATLVTPTNGRRILAALALLGPMARTHAAGVVWPDVVERRALGSLRTTVWRLRRVEPDLIESWDECLRLGPKVRVDVSAFSTWAIPLVQSDRFADVIDAAIPPWGDLLPGWDDEWMLFERERLRQLRLHALEALARRLCAEGRFAAAVSAALEAMRLEPLRESAHHTLICVYLAENNAAEAWRQYATFSRILGNVLGIEPSARLRALLEPQT
jgi:DNA-binding SARP family transcriptional activator